MRNNNTFKVASLFDEIYIAKCSEETGEIVSHEYGDGVEIVIPKQKFVRYWAVMKSNGYQSKEHEKCITETHANNIAARRNRSGDGYAYSVTPVYFTEDQHKQENLF